MKKFLFYCFVVCVVGALAGVAAFFVITKDLPNPEVFDSRKVAQSTKIYDRTGEIPLYEIHGEEKRTIIPFTEIPELMKKATIAIEDNQFYNHPAFDWKSLVRAALVNLKAGGVVQGGSTITQQLAKNAFLTSERTITRKIKELALSFKLEKKYSKDKILDLYLNQIPYGANSYGVEAASQSYFRKSVKDLSLPEIALLAAVPKAPSYYSPWGDHKDALLKRKDLVLDRMAEQKYITEKERDAAKKKTIEFAQLISEIKAPHFVIAVQDYLNNQYGEDFVRTAGLKVTTTLDYTLQQLAEKSVLEGAQRNEELYSGKNAALVAQDAKTGQVLALVGSRDYFDVENNGNFNVATQGLRQPGSTIKPFAYVTAFKEGFTPDTIVFDLETEFDATGDLEKSYKPQNFDEQFLGPVPLKVGLAQSRNVPSVKTLYLAGIDSTLKTARDFGITTLTERSRYGLSLVLGGGETKLIDMVGAYSVFSQEGIKHKQSMILKIEDSSGKTIEEYKDTATKVIDAQYPQMINAILSDIDLRRPLFQNSLYLTQFPNQEVALKTGTTNDYRDAWAMGYTPSLVVGVWAGNNDNAPMVKKGTSILAAVPIWSAFMREALKDKPLETFNHPEPVYAEKPIMNGQYVINNQVHDILYYVDKKDPLGPAPLYPDNDSQFKNWEDPVIEWLKTNPIDQLAATQTVGITSASSTALIIQNPANGSFIKGGLVVDVVINTSQIIQKIEVYLNNQLINSSAGAVIPKTQTGYTYHAEFNPANFELQNKLKVRVINQDNTAIEKEIIVFK